MHSKDDTLHNVGRRSAESTLFRQHHKATEKREMRVCSGPQSAEADLRTPNCFEVRLAAAATATTDNSEFGMGKHRDVLMNKPLPVAHPMAICIEANYWIKCASFDQNICPDPLIPNQKPGSSYCTDYFAASFDLRTRHNWKTRTRLDQFWTGPRKS